MGNVDIDCRCMGLDRRTRHEAKATQEDGLCDRCRCPHGCCSDHGEDEAWSPTLFFEDPVAWMDWFAQATFEINQCAGQKAELKMREAEAELGG